MKDYKALRSPKDTMEYVIEDVFEAGYKQGYEDGKADTPFTDTEEAEKKAYNRGLNEAWDAARKIHDGQIPYEVFGLDKTGNGFTYASPLNWGENITAQEAIDKIKAYEEKQDEASKIKAGDEVRDDVYGHIGVVITDKPSNLDQISVWFPDYSHVQLIDINHLIKMDRNFPQIAEVLKELRGAK